MSDKKTPMVRVGDNWVPAHRIWNIVEAMNTATDLVEKFNEKRAELSTETTREVVGTVRGRIRSMELEMGGPGTLQSAAEAAGIDTTGASLGHQGDNALEADDESARGETEIAAPNANPRIIPENDYVEAAKQLIGAMSVDEALRMLKADYDNPLDLTRLVELVGEEAYLGALAREAKDLSANMIAADQIAELWNETHYPSPVGNQWTETEVAKLLV